MKCSVFGVMKWVLLIFNVLLAISGLATIVMAFLNFKTASTFYICFLIIHGAVKFTAAVFGYLGVRKQDVRLTATYAIMIALLLVTEIVALSVVFGLCTIEMIAAKGVDAIWKEEILFPGAMDNIQQKYHCCGQDSPDDYLSIDRDAFPSSCYPNMVVDETALWEIGCVEAADDQFSSILNCVPNDLWANLVCMVWTDQKKYFRKKAKQNQEARNQTGGGQFTEKVLSTIEQRVFDLTSIQPVMLMLAIYLVIHFHNRQRGLPQA